MNVSTPEDDEEEESHHVSNILSTASLTLNSYVCSAIRKAGGDNFAMQFALPPRKTSNPPPYSRPSRSTIQRRNELRTTAVLGCAIISILFLVYYMSASNVPTAVTEVSGVSDKSKVVIVTVLDDDTYGTDYTQKVKDNREDYAKRHGKTDPPYPFILLLLLTLPLLCNRIHQLLY
jgi:hypothetical protein